MARVVLVAGCVAVVEEAAVGCVVEAAAVVVEVGVVVEAAVEE